MRGAKNEQRLDADGNLRIVSAAGPLADEVAYFLAREQPVEVGVNWRERS